MLVDIGLKFFCSTNMANLGDLEVRVTDLEILCSDFGKVFITISSDLLNILMNHVDTLHVDRYGSQVLCCTIMTHLVDL